MSEQPVFQAHDPSSGQAGPSYPGLTQDQAVAVVRQVRARFEDWKRTPVETRAGLIRAAGAVLRRRKAELAELMTAEMGKTLTEGLAEVEKCAAGCDFFAEHGPAYLVLEDADIEQAAEVAATARMVNGGQSCIAGKRFIAVAAVREAFEQALTKKLEAFAMGDPRLAETKLGPMQSLSARDEIHDQVLRSVAAGARILTGGYIPGQPGAWYPATVLTHVLPGQPAHDEEVFGPVAAVIEARDEADAVRIANDSPFGLGSGVLTRDLERGERIATEQLEAGSSFVNQNVRSDFHLPFGGVKHSGYGRELTAFGIREFCNIKSVLVQTPKA